MQCNRNGIEATQKCPKCFPKRGGKKEVPGKESRKIVEFSLTVFYEAGVNWAWRIATGDEFQIQKEEMLKAKSYPIFSEQWRSKTPTTARLLQ